MISPLLELDDDNFDTEVLNSEIPVVVEFRADWCAPCRAVSPSIERLANEFGGTVKFGRMDIDANPRVIQEFDAGSIPAIVIFEHGGVVESLVGVRPYERYRQAVSQLKPESHRS